MNETQGWNALEGEPFPEPERTTGWNPWKVILIFSFLQILIFAIEWFFFGAAFLHGSY